MVCCRGYAPVAGVVAGLLLAAATVSHAVPPSGGAIQPPVNPVRQVISLSGAWLFQRDGAPANQWKTVTVPSSFEQHEGIEFDGVGWYRKHIEPFVLPPGKRVLLHFQAAATEAEVWWDGERLGTHLGAWTPFRFDITEQVRKTPAGQPHELRVRLDEKVGHNTQGFLPIVAPHFGGLWQEVTLLIVPATYCNDLHLLAVGDLATSEVRLEVPLAGDVPEDIGRVAVRSRLRGERDWVALSPGVVRSGDTLVCRAPMPDARPWSPAEPWLYEVEVVLPGSGGDIVHARVGFRTADVFGQQFRLNGRPLQIRGLLNWGYSPPLTAPNPGEAVWRSELEFARACGFNLMKFCLWVPPKRYLELADEMGILTWMEYPTWHPTLTTEFLEPLCREFAEFFDYDRNHPSVFLRSLTCETGSSADLKVIQRLHNLAKAAIPGAIVEDDSSWIGWNRVHDFYDDHPYGNNHTWVQTLQGFHQHILAHGLKPLVLGEAICADTWIDREAILEHLGAERPWWSSSVLDAVPRWTERMQAVAGPGGIEQLREDSLSYGLLMRKFQAEVYRREVPYGGYVISVIRDIPRASMGLIDYLGSPKWSEADWSWQRDTICLLKTDADRRSFASGERLHGDILVSHFGRQAIDDGRLEVTLETADRAGPPLQHSEDKDIDQEVGTLAARLALDWPLQATAVPVRLVIRATLTTAAGVFRNEWPIWVVPASVAQTMRQVEVHESLGKDLEKELLPGVPRYRGGSTDVVVVAARFDEGLVRFLEAGGRVLLLPDGQVGSLSLGDHWFLRGAPYVPGSALAAQAPRDLLVELQHFDLAGQVVGDIQYIEGIDPILMLWDTHDLATVKTHGLIFETRVGKGRLLVSAVRHEGEGNAAGRWLLGTLIDHLRTSTQPKNALPNDIRTYLRAEGPQDADH
ncbi:MAG: hypothetical protein KBE65_21275 [Phycisphaerae bacterium]|nr:hypothetical protein [Phycisphaerae bacterium]